MDDKKSFFRRFPELPEDKARELARALDFEAKAGEALTRGPEADRARHAHLRDQARAAWAAVGDVSQYVVVR